jgi:hypothetical protein
LHRIEIRQRIDHSNVIAICEVARKCGIPPQMSGTSLKNAANRCSNRAITSAGGAMEIQSGKHLIE